MIDPAGEPSRSHGVAVAAPNDLAAAKSSKNGNVIYAFNESGRQVELSLRVLLGSDDDKFLNSRLQEQKSDFSGFILLTGSFELFKYLN